MSIRAVFVTINDAIQFAALDDRRTAFDAAALKSDQLFFDLYPQTRALRQVKIAFRVHQWGVLHHGEAMGIRRDGRVVQDLDPRCVRPGGDGVELGYGAEVSPAVMGNHSLVVRSSQGCDLAKAGDAIGHHHIGLQNAEDILFQHPAVFVYAAIVLSPGDGNAHEAAQLSQLIEGVTRPWFFQP